MGYRKMFGCLPSPEDKRDYTIKPACVGMASYPEEFSLIPRAVKNQGNVGSCVAHAVSEIAEYHNFDQEGTDITMSAGFIYGYRPSTMYQGVGMYIRDALSTYNKIGIMEHSEYNHNYEVPQAVSALNAFLETDKGKAALSKAYDNRCSAYVRMYTESEIKYALMNFGPVIFMIPWYNDMRLVNGALSTSFEGDTDSYHCMMLYGWNAKGWLIQNSWSKYWGTEGRAIMPYEFNSHINEAWSICDDITNLKTDNDSEDTTDPVEPDPIVPEPEDSKDDVVDPVEPDDTDTDDPIVPDPEPTPEPDNNKTSIFAKIIQFIINLFKSIFSKKK